MSNFNNCINFVLSHEGGYFEDLATGEKTVKKSGLWFKDVIKEHGF